MSRLLSTEGIPAQHRVDFWRDAVCDALIHLDIDVDESLVGGFNGRIIQHADGELNYAEVAADGHSALRTRRQAIRHSEDCFLVLLQRAGWTELKQDGRETALRTGDFALFDSTRPYEMRLPSAFHHAVLKIPRTALRNTAQNVDQLTCQSISGNVGAGRILRNFLSTLGDGVSDLDVTGRIAVRDSLVALIGATLRCFSGVNITPCSSLERFHRERIRAVIDERLFDPNLNIESIAAEVGLSPRYVHRLFEAEPITLSAQIWQRRLETAHRALLDTARRRQSITDIAYSVGFKDPAHFSKMFKIRFGDSPRNIRLAHR
jgi:AraC-like DNA-binding protein